MMYVCFISVVTLTLSFCFLRGVFITSRLYKCSNVRLDTWSSRRFDRFTETGRNWRTITDVTVREISFREECVRWKHDGTTQRAEIRSDEMQRWLMGKQRRRRRTVFTQLLSFILSLQYHHPHRVCYSHTLYIPCVFGGFLTPEGSKRLLKRGLNTNTNRNRSCWGQISDQAKASLRWVSGSEWKQTRGDTVKLLQLFF